MGSMIFDIETGPLPDDQMAKFIASVTAENIKLGRLKDPEKIKAKVEEKRQKLLEDAALSATTGRVLAIGFLFQEQSKITPKEWTEQDILRFFWEQFHFCQKNGRKLVGFNILHFDLPFLMRRSWLLGVHVPDDVMEGRRFWSKTLIDLAATWNCGLYGEFPALDEIMRAMGLSGKNGKATDFAPLWLSNDKAAQDQAVKYLENDLRMTFELAKRMGVAE